MKKIEIVILQIIYFTVGMGIVFFPVLALFWAPHESYPPANQSGNNEALFDLFVILVPIVICLCCYCYEQGTKHHDN